MNQRPRISLSGVTVREPARLVIDGHDIARAVWLSATAPVVEIAPGPAAALTSIEGIPIAEVGIDWQSGAGNVTMTERDLADAAEAVRSDRSILPPRFGVGHDGVWADARPAFGRYENLRLSDNKQALIADLVGIPVWLKAILPTAWPNRSIFGRRDVTSDAGKTWSCVIDRVDSLGIVLPAIPTLPDLAMCYGAEPPPGVKLNGQPIAASAFSMSMDVDLIRRAFWHDFCTGDRVDWFLRSLRTAPDEVIAEDDDGNLWQVPFTVNGDAQEVTFGEASRVIEEYVAASAAPARERAHYRTRDASRAGIDKETGMDPKKVALRRALGLADDATDDQVKAKRGEIAAAVAAAGDTDDGAAATGDDETPPPAEPTEPAPTTPPATPPAEGAPAGQPSNPAQGNQASVEASAGTVTLDTATFQQLKHGAELAIQMSAQKREHDRDEFLLSAVKAGKFPPARVEHYRKLYDVDPEGTTTVINSLAEGMIPVVELGSTNGGLEDDGGSGLESLYSPEERQRIALASGKSAGTGAAPVHVQFSSDR
jgi:hypothetical protein